MTSTCRFARRARALATATLLLAAIAGCSASAPESSAPSAGAAALGANGYDDCPDKPHCPKCAVVDPPEVVISYPDTWPEGEPLTLFASRAYDSVGSTTPDAGFHRDAATGTGSGSSSGGSSSGGHGGTIGITDPGPSTSSLKGAPSCGDDPSGAQFVAKRGVRVRIDDPHLPPELAALVKDLPRGTRLNLATTRPVGRWQGFGDVK